MFPLRVVRQRGNIIMGMEMLDTFGVVEHFVTDIGAIEFVGGGIMRTIRCIKRNGVLIPVCSLVTPLEDTIRNVGIIREAAQEFYAKDRLTVCH